ncbi:cytochrome-c peroxidase [Hyunsoonleella sp. SJ7]|uniref:Cytochrome-c peroxidase n=1 Tax=Hyunsoonleella aquatilis TaxID=2762758 RepID=A0A923H8K7_9FLAO|nr:cytochrome c peroxidase [Hyunsoonleella aquatilis]MBC3758268.1 cytochrome-c peroxidase [Hyunsoonleella aquatilis]
MIRKPLILILLCITFSCEEESGSTAVSKPTPSPLQIPKLFSDNILNPVIPIDNPQTVEGIALGKKLFFDPILSVDNSQSCADCHAPENAFTDSDRFSDGVDGIRGNRNSMPLFNLAWHYDETFFWDGNTFSLEHQAFVPVTDPIEMKSSWVNVEQKLQQHSEYPKLFEQAFGTSTIDSTLVTKAIAQFERTLISANSKFDKFLLGETELTPEELNGFNVFMDEARGDCFHCHGSEKNPLWTDNLFHNNGLDETFTDLGLGVVTGNPADNGKFRSPSLRNLKFTAPYMHDGRFANIDEVINHYSEGLKRSSTIDPLMKKIDQGGVGLTEKDKADLKAFLLSLSDDEFVNNSAFGE